MVRVDKLQNRAWSKASLPALAFLEAVAAGHQEQQQLLQRGAGGGCSSLGVPQTPPAHAPEVRAVWEREAWLKRGQHRLVMRLNAVKMVPVRLEDYLSDDLRTLAKSCIAGAEALPDEVSVHD